MNPLRYCKECNVQIPKGQHYCTSHHNKWNRPSFKELECRQCNVLKPKHHFHKGKYICKVCLNLNGNDGKEFNSTSLIGDILGKNAQKVFTRHKSFTRHDNQQKAKLPNHIKEKKLRLKEFRELKRKYEKELRWAEYLVKKKDVHINRAKEGIQNRKKELDVMLGDLVDYMMKGLPMSDFKNKKDWTRSITQMETIISKYLNIPISVVKKKRKEKYRTDTMWLDYIDDEIKKIQPNYTGNSPWILECLGKCGEKYKYPSRSALVRALGLGGNNDKKYAGYCETCGQSQPQSEDMKRKVREAHLKNLGFDSWEEYEKNVFVMGEYKYYAEIVRRLSHKNLKKYKPNEYKKFKSNPFISTMNNYETGLTIEHTRPVSECWRKQIPIKKAAHTDNLEVITMKQNNELWLEYVKKKIH